MIQLKDFVERAFNEALIILIDEVEEIQISEKTERETWLHGELLMFLDRLARIYALQADMESDGDSSHALAHAAETFMNISDNLSDLSSEEFSIFIAIHNPESSIDVQGSMRSAKLLFEEGKR